MFCHMINMISILSNGIIPEEAFVARVCNLVIASVTMTSWRTPATRLLARFVLPLGQSNYYAFALTAALQTQLPASMRPDVREQQRHLQWPLPRLPPSCRPRRF